MPRRQRPSLSSPSYGSFTGRINWSRGMDERLAQGPSYAPPVQAETTTPAAAPASSTPRGGAYTRTYGAYYGGRRPYRNIEQEF